MIAADRVTRRSADAKLLVLHANGELRHMSRLSFVDVLKPGDLIVANDAATLPASLHGSHVPSGATIEVRLAGRRSLEPTSVSDCIAVVFGAGDFHIRTEHRQLPPSLHVGDHLALGTLDATITAILNHPRLVALHFNGTTDAIWAGIARHGRPIQYAHVATPLEMWDVWTALASRPVAFEPPSAGFAIDWQFLNELHARGVSFATITHAAGISSTGDDELDRQLPFDEPYEIPRPTADAIKRAKSSGARVIAIGTTVVRALEHASGNGIVKPGAGVATERIGPQTELAIVDAVLTGVHEPGTSHYDLLRAFADDAALEAANNLMTVLEYRSHEFGDSVFVERGQKCNDLPLWATENAGDSRGMPIAAPVS